MDLTGMWSSGLAGRRERAAGAVHDQGRSSTRGSRPDRLSEIEVVKTMANARRAVLWIGSGRFGLESQ
jgi:hypothetical protein